jgi:predicted DsbA family dithiol-disulfide isomerase
METPTRTVTLDLFSDIACPWCYVGEARLEQAMERTGIRVERRWHPFQLQPQMPPDTPWMEFAPAKFGGEHMMKQAFGHVSREGADVGIRFDFEQMPYAPNTMDAHRLILWAQDTAGTEPAFTLAHALYRAYFEEARHVGDPSTLADIAAQVGLDREAAAAHLASDAGRETVTQSQREAERLGVRGVPFFVLNGRHGLSGAQPVEVFEGALRQLASEGADAEH